MPVYEYRCSSCRKKFAALVGMVSGAASGKITCPACGSRDVSRLISRFSRTRSDDERLDAFEDAALAGGDDPAAMSKLMREMGREMSDDGDDGIDEFLDQSEREIYDGPGDAAEF